MQKEIRRRFERECESGRGENLHKLRERDGRQKSERERMIFRPFSWSFSGETKGGFAFLRMLVGLLCGDGAQSFSDQLCTSCIVCSDDDQSMSVMK